MIRRCPFLLVATLFGIGAAFGSDNPVDVNIRPAFLGNDDAAVESYRADLFNNTAETQVGEISVEPSGTSYPFPLPPMGRRGVFLYHTDASWGRDWSWNVHCSP